MKNEQNQTLVYRWTFNGQSQEAYSLRLSLAIHEADEHSSIPGQFLGTAMLMNEANVPVIQKEVKDLAKVECDDIKKSLLLQLGAELEVA